MPKGPARELVAKRGTTVTRKKSMVDNPLFEPTARIEDTEEEIVEASARAAVAQEDEMKPAARETESVVETPAAASAKVRALERRNKELLVRIGELELERAQSTMGEGVAAAEEGYGTVPEESQSVIYIVKDLERQLDDAFALKEALEADLAAMQSRLSDESSARRQLDARVQLLDAQAALAEQLREEISFVEEERNDIARKLKDSEAQLERVTSERNALVERVDTAEMSVKNLELEKVDSQARVLNLEENVRDLGAARKELDQVVIQREDLIQQVQKLTGRIDASETSKSAVEQDLAASRKEVSRLRAEVGKLREKHTAAESAAAELDCRIEDQQVKNQNLLEANRRLERELEALTAENQAISSELEAAKKALHDIHSAASRTTERFRGRYYKLADSKDEENEKNKDQS